MPKGTSRAKATSNSEKIKPVAVAVIELLLSEGISQLLTYVLTQSVENSVEYFFFKFRSNLLKVFQVDLKACLGLVLPNQYCLIIVWEIEVILWAMPTPLYCMIVESLLQVSLQGTCV